MHNFETLLDHPDHTGLHYRCLKCGSMDTSYTATDNKEVRPVRQYDQDGDEYWVEREVIVETVVFATCRHCKNTEYEVM